MLEKAIMPPFSEGQHVYYPGSGVATIVAITDVEAAGLTMKSYVLLCKDEARLQVPLAKAAQNGMRHIETKVRLATAVDVIKGKPHASGKTWQLRAQASEVKLHGNDMLAIAEVIRDLYVPEDKAGDRSDTARRLYEQAFRLFLPEAALILGMTEQGALMYLAGQTGKEFKASLATGKRESVAVSPAKYRTPATAPAAPAKHTRAAAPAAPRPAAPPSAPRTAAVLAPPPAAHPRPPLRLVVSEQAAVRPATTTRAPSVAPAGNGKDERAQALAATDELRRQLLAARGEAEGIRRRMESERSSHRTSTDALQAQLTARTLEAKALEEQLSAAQYEQRTAREQLHGVREQLKEQESRMAELETAHRDEIGRLQELFLWVCIAFFASEAERSRMTHAVVAPPSANATEAPVAPKPPPKKRSGLKRQPGGFLWDPKWDREMAKKQR